MDEELERELLALKPQIDHANTSTVCEKEELDLPFGVTAKDIKLENATKNLPIPLHPGAERFYKEAGVLK